jgi:uncharacterized protein (TIGR03000 family)
MVDGTANIVVSLPVNATLTINDQPTNSTSETRVFVTPTLDEGKDFVYTLKAQVEQDGKVTTLSKDITVRAGQEVNVNFEAPTTVAAK